MWFVQTNDSGYNRYPSSALVQGIRARRRCRVMALLALLSFGGTNVLVSGASLFLPARPASPWALATRSRLPAAQVRSGPPFHFGLSKWRKLSQTSELRNFRISVFGMPSQLRSRICLWMHHPFKYHSEVSFIQRRNGFFEEIRLLADMKSRSPFGTVQLLTLRRRRALGLPSRFRR